MVWLKSWEIIFMDKKIERKKGAKQKYYVSILIFAGFLIVSYIFYGNKSHASKTANKEELVIEKVIAGTFNHSIPVNGTIQPNKTFFLDALEGGTVTDVLMESGEAVSKGDTILRLSNSNLELEVMQHRTQLFEQVNNLRQTKLLINQNDRNQRNQLTEIEYQLNLIRPQHERYTRLLAKGVISERDFEEIDESYRFYSNLKLINYQSYKTDSIARKFQLAQLLNTEERMKNSLKSAKEILKGLIVVAPKDGQLTTTEMEVGQSVEQGERLGQVDIVTSFKVRAGIDELYLPRVSIGKLAEFSFNQRTYRLKIDKIYPTVEEGRFEVDMVFLDDVPKTVKLGQTVRLDLELGNPRKSLLLPVGNYFNDTGGHWVFILDKSGNRAYKKNITIGDLNREYLEVLKGLSENDRVITSSYRNFTNQDELIIQ
ncbi:MAG: HlyD family efflux transporter periplasmic adaptor subunit [Bacteroidota bacterium]